MGKRSIKTAKAEASGTVQSNFSRSAAEPMNSGTLFSFESTLRPFLFLSRPIPSRMPPGLQFGNPGLCNPAQGLVGLLLARYAHLDQKCEPTRFVVVQAVRVGAARSVHKVGLRWRAVFACFAIVLYPAIEPDARDNLGPQFISQRK